MPGSSDAHLASRNRAYIRAKRMLEAGGQYVVNNEAAARDGKKKNLRVAQSYLCSILPLTANNTQYVFNVMDNQFNQGNSTILPMEQRLKLQDVFFTSALGFYMVIMGYGGAAQSNQYQLFASPPPGVSGPLPLLPDVSALTGIWSGKLEVKVNGETVTPYWRTQQHIVINQTQSSPGVLVFDQIDYALDGLVVTEPNWIVNGGNNNLYTVTYGNNWSGVLGTANLNSSINLGICMIWDGWLAQNASSIMDNATAFAK